MLALKVVCALMTVLKATVCAQTVQASHPNRYSVVTKHFPMGHKPCGTSRVMFDQKSISIALGSWSVYAHGVHERFAQSMQLSWFPTQAATSHARGSQQASSCVHQDVGKHD